MSCGRAGVGTLRVAVLVGACLVASVVGAQSRNVLPSGPVGKAPGRVVDTSWMFPRIADVARAPVRAFRGGNGFPGLASVGPSPANADVAVGPQDLVQVVNGRIAIFTKDGTQTFGQNATSFFAGLAQTSELDQPQVEFDRHSGRFFMVFLESSVPALVSNFLLAVSDDETAAGPWFQYRVSAIGTFGITDHWSQKPSLAVNEDGIVIASTIARFSDSVVAGSMFTTIPKAPALTGQPVAWKPALDMSRPYAYVGDSQANSAPYVFGVVKTAQNMFRIYRVKNTGSAITALVNFIDHTTTQVPVPPSTVASTNDGAIVTGLDRLIAVASFGERVFAAVNMSAGSDLSCIRWFEWDLAQMSVGTITNVAGGTLNPGLGSWFMPAAGVNAHGDIGLLFSEAGLTVTSDLMIAGRRILDPFAMMSVPQSAASAHSATYFSTDWGAWFGVGTDGGDGETMWGTAMVVGSNGFWATEIVKWWVTQTSYVLPTSATWFRGTLVSGPPGALFADDDVYLVGRAGPASIGEAPAQLVVEGQAPVGEVFGVEFSASSHVNTSGLSRRIELWDWTAGAYVNLGSVPASSADTLHLVAAPAPLARFVSATRTVRARVSWFQSGPVVVWPWTVWVDRAGWRVRVR